MKLTSGIALAATCCTASASTAHVYTHDPTWQPAAAAGQLSPIEARLVLAQRAGVEDFHEADVFREGVLDAMNAYGVRKSLFDSADEEAKRAFIFFEGAYDAESRHASFDISPAPSAEESRNLFIDLATQAFPSQLATLSDNERLSALRGCSAPSPNDQNLFCIAESAQELSQLLDTLTTWSVTALVTPTHSILDSVLGSTQPSWGTYEMPSAQSPLRKRGARMPRIDVEEPLELIHHPAKASASVAQAFSTPISAFAGSDTNNTVVGILPACFSSQSACETYTKNCTGHGSCYKKYTDFAADPKSPYKDCYACGCSATVQTDSQGRTSTTTWGGPACQKKDVSSAFWLIVLFVVGMVFLIGFAVGEVWGMGEQELPSVIGAGVSGPVKR